MRPLSIQFKFFFTSGKYHENTVCIILADLKKLSWRHFSIFWKKTAYVYNKIQKIEKRLHESFFKSAKIINKVFLWYLPLIKTFRAENSKVKFYKYFQYISAVFVNGVNGFDLSYIRWSYIVNFYFSLVL